MLTSPEVGSDSHFEVTAFVRGKLQWDGKPGSGAAEIQEGAGGVWMWMEERGEKIQEMMPQRPVWPQKDPSRGVTVTSDRNRWGPERVGAPLQSHSKPATQPCWEPRPCSPQR